jgi:glycosyltransferase A (GT-A) superfamily protein (DUF2064 family)
MKSRIDSIILLIKQDTPRLIEEIVQGITPVLEDTSPIMTALALDITDTATLQTTYPAKIQSLDTAADYQRLSTPLCKQIIFRKTIELGDFETNKTTNFNSMKPRRIIALI